jgi:hypothetical protein
MTNKALMDYLGISRGLYYSSVKTQKINLRDLGKYFKSTSSYRKRRDYLYDKYRKTVAEHFLDELWTKFVEAETRRIEEREYNQWVLQQRKKEVEQFTEKQPS